MSHALVNGSATTPMCLHTCLPAWLLPACLPAGRPACLPACLPAWLQGLQRAVRPGPQPLAHHAADAGAAATTSTGTSTSTSGCWQQRCNPPTSGGGRSGAGCCSCSCRWQPRQRWRWHAAHTRQLDARAGRGVGRAHTGEQHDSAARACRSCAIHWLMDQWIALHWSISHHCDGPSHMHADCRCHC